MPSFDIVKSIEPEQTFKVASVMGKFDLQINKIQETFEGDIPIEEEDWNIGVIYGASGTGKTTIAREIFKKIVNYKYKAPSVIDDINGSVDEMTKAFNFVGFSSPPSWLKPYSVLSNGEKMRVDMARAIVEDSNIIVFDEFTSVINRDVAKIGSSAIQKAIRKQNKKFVAVSCHYDILDWLEPDWEFCTDTMSFLKKKDKDQKLNLKFGSVQMPTGAYLESIII